MQLRLLSRYTHQFFHKLFSSNGLRQVALVIGGNAGAQLASAIALMIITRQLGPERYGAFSVGFALLLMLNRVNDLGMTFVTHRDGAQAQSNEERNTIFSYTTWVKLKAAILIALVGALATPLLSGALSFDQPLIIAAAFILSAITVMYEHLLAILQSLHRFSQVVIANALQSGAKLAVSILFWLSGSVSSLGIFIAYMIGPLLPLLLFPKLLPKWFALRLEAARKPLSSSSKTLAKHATVSLMAAGIVENIDVLFVQGYLDSYETGLLGGVSRIALLINMAAFSLGTVLNPRVAQFQTLIEIRTFLKKAWLLTLASLGGFILFIPFAPWSISLTIGDAYLPGVSTLLVLMAAGFLTLATMPFIALFFRIELPWYFSVAGVVQLCLIVSGNVVFVPEFGIDAAAWTRLFTRVVLFGMTVGLAYWAIARQPFTRTKMSNSQS